MFKKAAFILLFFSFLLNQTFAQVSPYRYFHALRPFVSLTSGITLPNLVNDGAISTPINLGFTFHLYDGTYTQVQIAHDGYLTFAGNQTLSNIYNSMSNQDDLMPVIAPLWDEMNGQGGTVRYATQGTAPNRVFVVEWKSWHWPVDSTQPHNFQVRLFETTDKIEFHYGEGNSFVPHRSATVGIGDKMNRSLTILTDTEDGFDVDNSADENSIFPANGKILGFEPKRCFPPTDLRVDSIIDTRATLHWTPLPTSPTLSNPTSYHWRIYEDDHRWGRFAQSGLAPDSTTVVTNLQPNTYYQIALGATCANGDTSDWVTEKFLTLQAADLRVPFFEGFEADSTRLPRGWYNFSTSFPWIVGTGRSITDYYGGVTKAAEGRNFIHVGTDGDHSTVLSPLIATTQQTPRLCYKYWIGYNDAYIRDDGRSPFELTIEELYTDSKVIREYRYNNTNLSISRDSGWQTETIDLIGYENSLIKIGFVAASPSHLRFLDVVAVDSFSIVNAPSCVPPASVIATVYAGDSLKLTWLAERKQTQWVIEYGIKGFTLGTGTRVTANRNPFTLHNLQGNTNYDFYIRAICSTSDASDWSKVATARTLCNSSVTQFPYHEGFDSLTLNSCWHTEGSRFHSEWRLNYDSSLTKPLLPVGGRGYIKSVQTDPVKSILYSPAFRLDNSPKVLTYSFVHDFVTGHPSYPGQLTTEISTDQVKWDTLATHTFKDSIIVNGADSWLRKTFDLSNYKNKTIVIRFRLTNTNVANSRFALDDFTIDNINNTCQPPTDLSSSGFNSDNIIELAWTKGRNETSWELEYGNNAFQIGTGTRLQIMGGVPRKILRGGALANKEFYVRSNCGNNTYSRWVGPLKMNTSRQAVYAMSAYPLADINLVPEIIDWKSFNFLGGTCFNNGRTCSCRTYQSTDGIQHDVYNVSPRILNLRARTHQLRFHIKNKSSIDKAVSVGVMSSRLDTGSYTMLQRFNLPNGIDVTKTISFSNYNLDKDFLVFKWEDTPVFFGHIGEIVTVIDSIEWERIPTCSTPRNVVIDTLKIGNTFVTVNWKNGNTVPNTTTTGYRWRVVPNNGTPFDKKIIKEGISNADSVKIEGLEMDTKYTFFVQSFCQTATDTSTYWTEGTTFQTARFNDDCAFAVPLSIFPPAANPRPQISSYFFTDMTIGRYQSSFPTDNIGCSTPKANFHDVWYVVTMPNATTPVWIKTYSPRLLDLSDWTMAVYKGTCDNLTYVGCNDNYGDPNTDLDYLMPSFRISNYTPGTKYYIRLYLKYRQNWSDDDRGQIIALCDSDCPKTVTNDSCQNAIQMISGQGYSEETTTATSSPSNTDLNLSCEPNQNVKDIWYKFHTGSDNNRVSKVAISFLASTVGLNPNPSAKYAVYKGVCGNMTRISDCKAAPLYTDRTDTISLTEANQDYFIRVWASVDSPAIIHIQLQNIENVNVIPLAHAITTNACKPFSTFEINNTNKNKWVSIADETGIVAEINANGNLLGQVTGSYFVNSSGTIRNAGGLPYLDRNIGIHAANQPTQEVSLRLYFTDADMAAYYNAVGSLPLAVTHYTGALCAPTALSVNGELLPGTIGKTPNDNYYIQFNTQRFSGFVVGPYAVIIPVELMSFTASQKENLNLIQWITASEKENAFFELERSPNGFDFMLLATIKGKGTTSMQSFYSFEDANPLNISYYRLKQTDINGNSTYSKTVSVARGKTTQPPRFYPSVTKGNLTIELFSDAKATVTITNLMGQVVLTKNNLTSTSQLDISSLLAGFYVVSIHQERIQVTGRIIKQ